MTLFSRDAEDRYTEGLEERPFPMRLQRASDRTYNFIIY